MLETEQNHLLQAVIRLQKEYNSEAFRLIYDQLYPKLYYICLRYLNDADDADDALQDVFIIVYEKIGSYKGEGNFEGWVKRITVNHCIHRLKKKKLRFALDEKDLPSEEQPSPDKEGVEVEMKEKLQKALSQLPSGFRTVINLSVIEGYAHKEIAEMLGISEGTSRSQLNRAKAALKKQMLKHG